MNSCTQYVLRSTPYERLPTKRLSLPASENRSNIIESALGPEDSQFPSFSSPRTHSLVFYYMILSINALEPVICDTVVVLNLCYAAGNMAPAHPGLPGLSIWQVDLVSFAQDPLEGAIGGVEEMGAGNSIL